MSPKSSREMDLQLSPLWISSWSLINHFRAINIPPNQCWGTFRTLDHQDSGWVAVLKNLIFKPWLPQLLEVEVPHLNIGSVKVNFLLSALHLPALHRLANSLKQEDLSQPVPGTLKVAWWGNLRNEGSHFLQDLEIFALILLGWLQNSSAEHPIFPFSLSKEIQNSEAKSKFNFM